MTETGNAILLQGESPKKKQKVEQKMKQKEEQQKLNRVQYQTNCNEIYRHTTLSNNLRFKLCIQEQLLHTSAVPCSLL